MKLVNTNESIESNKARIELRKITYQAPVKFSKYPKRLNKVTINIRGEVHISEELSPKEPIIDVLSHLDLNDYLEAEIIEVFCEERLPRLSKASNVTSTHSAMIVQTRSFTYAKIKQPFRAIFELEQKALDAHTRSSFRKELLNYRAND